MSKDSIVITSAVRTPIGALQGVFSPLSAADLGAAASREAIAKSNLNGQEIDEVLFGCVLPAGLGQAPARQVAIHAGLDKSTPCTTISKVCGSGMKAVMLGYEMIKAESCQRVLVGGMESMTNAPYMIPKARAGLRFGHGEIIDHMLYDGLQDAYEHESMGVYAQRMADKLGITREQMDDFAITSLRRAKQATESGYFEDEIVPVTVASRKGSLCVEQDETPQKVNEDKIPSLKPSFAKDGTVTAANSSSISDGAAALVVMKASDAKTRGLQPLVEIKAIAGHAQQPDEFTIAPIAAINKLLDKVGWTVADVDLFEINEAFAMVTMAAINALDLDPEKVNVNGGACALGHPIGATGARIIVTLIHALKRLGKTRGVACLCIGGGEATAVAIEVCE